MKQQDLKIFVLKLNKCDFQPLEVVGQARPPQVDENLNKSTEQDKG